MTKNRHFVRSDLNEAAKAAGVNSQPDWYVATHGNPSNLKLESGLGKVVLDARLAASLGAPELVSEEEEALPPAALNSEN